MTSPPPRWSGFYLPEIHDIAPPMAASLDDLMALFPTLAQQVVAHLIVPNWQGNWPLEDHVDFAGRLRKLGARQSCMAGPTVWGSTCLTGCFTAMIIGQSLPTLTRKKQRYGLIWAWPR